MGISSVKRGFRVLESSRRRCIEVLERKENTKSIYIIFEKLQKWEVFNESHYEFCHQGIVYTQVRNIEIRK